MPNSHTVAAVTTAAPKSRVRRVEAQEGETILFVGGKSHIHASARPAWICQSRLGSGRFYSIGFLGSGGLGLRALDQNPVDGVFPQGDEELSGHRHDGAFLAAARIALNTFTEPVAQR